MYPPILGVLGGQGEVLTRAWEASELREDCDPPDDESLGSEPLRLCSVRECAREEEEERSRSPARKRSLVRAEAYF